MNILDVINNSSDDYLVLICKTFIYILITWLIGKFFIYLNSKFNKNEKQLYFINRFIKIIRIIVYLCIIFILWKNHITNVVTIISVISAALTLALKDLILNLVSSIYIKLSKPFKLEDRIEIDDTVGDVINIGAISFQLLEVGEKEQSTGIIIEIPNSFVFSKKIKNYTKVIKYVWSEIYLNIDLNSDLKKVKSILYKIVNQNEVISSIPKKMEKAIDEASMDYRIYYNHLNPVIYTDVINNYIELSIRFLVHPKKKRYVESEIWNQIIEECNKGNIMLHQN